MRDVPAPRDQATDRLRLAQWLSPAFPIGGFAYSQGLEAAMAGGDVRCAATLAAWVAAVIETGSARTDAILLAHARAAGSDLDALDALARALAPSAERLTETLEQGAAFGAMMAAMDGTPPPPALPYPLAVGLAARPLALDTAEVVALWLHGQAALLVSAGVRFIPLGQGAGQAILAALAPRLAALAGTLAAAPLDAIATGTPRADLMAMAHETLTVRLYRS
ncbi:MAG: urease accessory protein UreF [Gemmobacter sp.]